MSVNVNRLIRGDEVIVCLSKEDTKEYDSLMELIEE